MRQCERYNTMFITPSTGNSGKHSKGEYHFEKKNNLTEPEPSGKLWLLTCAIFVKIKIKWKNIMCTHTNIGCQKKILLCCVLTKNGVQQSRDQSKLVPLRRNSSIIQSSELKTSWTKRDFLSWHQNVVLDLQAGGVNGFRLINQTMKLHE